MGRGSTSGVDIRVFASLMCHLRRVRYDTAAVRIVKKKKPLEQPATKFKLAMLVGVRGGGG